MTLTTHTTQPDLKLLSACRHFEPKTVRSQTQDTSALIQDISALRHTCIDPNAETVRYLSCVAVAASNLALSTSLDVLERRWSMWFTATGLSHAFWMCFALLVGTEVLERLVQIIGADTIGHRGARAHPPPLLICRGHRGAQITDMKRK